VPDQYEIGGPIQDSKAAVCTKTIWVTKEGSRIRVRDLEDSHLLNIIRLLRRNAGRHMLGLEISVLAYLKSDPPDGAYSAAEDGYADLLESDVDQFLHETCPTWPALLAEAERRKLQI
jgi:hypothetical protein